MTIVILLAFAVFALASGEEEPGNQGSGTVSSSSENKDTDIGDYSVIIDSCRLAKDYEGKDVVIVKYKFTNNRNDEATSFTLAFVDEAFQNGVGLNHAYVLDENANYNEDNQTKAIKKGATIDIEVAYELNDTTTDIEVEVEELFSSSEKTITKTFSINK